MSVSDADIAHATDLFDGLGGIGTRRMMGGLCLYSDGIIFAILLSDGRLHLKARAPGMIARLEAMGAERWMPARPDGTPVAMPYWSLPDAALDDPGIACDLARDTLRGLH
ncbi:TfoX/Sxy family protein [Roseovarius sp. SCSIO 43702]|uniref:TfoX/Sxy family protein n=1 Tax=Roseovarius sp. SCSIO 43702 TaxID=2823043 RepID=UPI001C7348C4|nr:TfoX/Sxy family protein [Roseovarius sp. SCSIO 43702]QYX55401.1 TfoX/Sxy family protein [Roseovarius sp. SCSIO 43702]